MPGAPTWLRDSGPDAQVARNATRTIVDLVEGARAAASPEEPAEVADARRRARVFLESLPPARYPRLVEAAGPLSECGDPEAYHGFGLDLLLAGIETMAARER